MNNIFFSTYLITNFKVEKLNKFNSINILKRDKNQIFCKNLFMFLILLKFKNKNFFQKSTIFVKPYKKKIYTILRSPYRHKLARHQIILNRYDIISSLKIKTSKIFNFNNFSSILKIFNFFKNFNYWFEWNLVYNHKIRVSYRLKYNNNYCISKFKN